MLNGDEGLFLNMAVIPARAYQLTIVVQLLRLVFETKQHIWLALFWQHATPLKQFLVLEAKRRRITLISRTSTNSKHFRLFSHQLGFIQQRSRTEGLPEARVGDAKRPLNPRQIIFDGKNSSGLVMFLLTHTIVSRIGINNHTMLQ